MKYSSALPLIAGVLAAFCIKSSVSQTNQRCYTPDQAVGECIDIFSCDYLLADLENLQRTTEQMLYLQQSKCNQIGSIFYVCCKLKHTSRSNFNLLPSTSECGRFFGNRIYGGDETKLDEYPWFASIEYTKYTDQQCFTPDGASGQCVNILKCDPLLEVLINVQRTPEETQYLQKSQCDYVDSSVYVCCNFERTSRSYVDLLPSTRECGKSFDNRIYGGSVTRIDEYPWLALIEYTKHRANNTKNFYCGGALINKRYVITAAHCVAGSGVTSNGKPTGVRLGEWDRSTDRDCQRLVNKHEECADPHVDVDIEEIIVYPNTKGTATVTSRFHDIALIRLSREVAYTDFVSPVCLPMQTELRTKTFEGVKLDVTGFGGTKNSSYSNLKLKAEVEAWNFEKCRAKYAPRKILLQDSQMCAGGQIDIDSCGGDSGGPLVTKQRLNKRDVYVLAGIVSFGPQKCGSDGWPGIYTRVGAYADWILKTIKV